MSKLKLPKVSGGDLLTVSSLSERLREYGFSNVIQDDCSLIYKRMSAQSSDSSSGGIMPHVLTPGFARAIKSTDFLYSRKLDGVRAVVCTLRGKLYLAFRNGVCMSIDLQTTQSFVCDVEIVATSEYVVFYVLDVSSYCGVEGANFCPTRLNNVYKVTDLLDVKLSVNVQSQYYTSFKNLYRTREEDWEGIVATRTRGAYHSHVLTQVYKFVRPERLTIDLEVRDKIAYTNDNVKTFINVCAKDGKYEFTLDGNIVRSRNKKPNAAFVVSATQECRDFTFERLFDLITQGTSAQTHRPGKCESPKQEGVVVPEIKVQPTILTIEISDDEEEDVNCHPPQQSASSSSTPVDIYRYEVATNDNPLAPPPIGHGHLIQQLCGTLEMYRVRIKSRSANLTHRRNATKTVKRVGMLSPNGLRVLSINTRLTDAALLTKVDQELYHTYKVLWKTSDFVYFVNVVYAFRCGRNLEDLKNVKKRFMANQNIEETGNFEFRTVSSTTRDSKEEMDDLKASLASQAVSMWNYGVGPPLKGSRKKRKGKRQG